ncbi:MAG: phosphoadenylyl-sulfate reductase [Saprospiraceae bacterium]
MTLYKVLPYLKVKKLDLWALNYRFDRLDPAEGLRKLYRVFDEEDVLVTTSFGTKSIYLIHLISQVNPGQKIYFVDTGFHFKETLVYKEMIEDIYDVNIVSLHPDEEPHRLTAEEEWWKDHPKMCCTINKIAPLDHIVTQHKVWVSSLMSYQTSFRAGLRMFEKQGDILKYHPLLHLPEEEFNRRLDKLELPMHPLAHVGYGSIGCTHCTIKGEGRAGRWSDRGKTECGLHVKYYNKK